MLHRNREDNDKAALTPPVAHRHRLSVACVASLRLRATSCAQEQNELAELPASFGHLDSLEQLHLGYNQLQALPDCLGSFTALQLLHVQGNRLQVRRRRRRWRAVCCQRRPPRTHARQLGSGPADVSKQMQIQHTQTAGC